MAKNNLIRLKVCGMRDAGNILQVVELQPEYMGFIFFPKSPRYVGEDFQVPADFSKAIRKVGVFVNETTEQMLFQVNRLGLHYVQLHGHEPVEQVLELKGKGVKVIKVFSVDDEFDFGTTTPYQESVDYFLFDTKGKYFGGNAQVFNWEVLRRYDQKVPFFLSGVESRPGLKDLGKIEKLKKVIELIR